MNIIYKIKMICYFIITIFLVDYQNVYAQYNAIKSSKTPLSMEIIQIDLTGFSTLIFFKYTNLLGTGAQINFDEKTYLKDTKTDIKYKLLNSINMPISGEGEPKHIFDKEGQYINFCLEFEKIPTSMIKFDLIEDEKNPNAFNFYEVKINKQVKTDFYNVDNFIKSTPVKEYGYIVQDGNIVHYYKHKGLFISMSLSIDKNYGKYYQACIDIKNFTGKNLLLLPNDITVQTLIMKEEKEEIQNLQTLSYEDYMKKVNRSQAWSSFAVAFGNAMSASNAGYSYSTTNVSTTGHSNTYDYASGHSSTYSTLYGSSTTRSYNGAAAYAAKQNADQNTNAYVQNQYEIKNKLSKGYLKPNTILNETEFMGYINIKFMKTDNITISIPINGETYVFQQNWKKK